MTRTANYPVKPYRKDQDYSYSLGAYTTIELLRARPEAVHAVYVHSAYRDLPGMKALCREHRIPVLLQDKAFAKVDSKENGFVFGVFD